MMKTHGGRWIHRACENAARVDSFDILRRRHGEVQDFSWLAQLGLQTVENEAAVDSAFHAVGAVACYAVSPLAQFFLGASVAGRHGRQSVEKLARRRRSQCALLLATCAFILVIARTAVVNSCESSSD